MVPRPKNRPTKINTGKRSRRGYDQRGRPKVQLNKLRLIRLRFDEKT